jgi:hypothetical protein
MDQALGSIRDHFTNSPAGSSRPGLPGTARHQTMDRRNRSQADRRAQGRQDNCDYSLPRPVPFYFALPALAPPVSDPLERAARRGPALTADQAMDAFGQPAAVKADQNFGTRQKRPCAKDAGELAGGLRVLTGEDTQESRRGAARPRRAAAIGVRDPASALLPDPVNGIRTVCMIECPECAWSPPARTSDEWSATCLVARRNEVSVLLLAGALGRRVYYMSTWDHEVARGYRGELEKT